MNEELDGLIASIDFTPSIDYSQIDDLVDKIDKIESEEHKVEIYVDVPAGDIEDIEKTVQGVVDYINGLTGILKIDIDGDFPTLLSNLKQLERVIRKLPVIKVDGSISEPQVASKAETKRTTSVATARKATESTNEDVKNLADTLTYTKALVGALKDAFGNYKGKVSDYQNFMNSYDKGMIDTQRFNNIDKSLNKTKIDETIKVGNANINAAVKEIESIYKQSLKLKDGTAEQILEVLKQIEGADPETEFTIESFKEVVENNRQKISSDIKEAFQEGIEKGKYKNTETINTDAKATSKKVWTDADILREQRQAEIEELLKKESVESDKFSVNQTDKNVSKYVEQLANALQNNTDAVKKETTEIAQTPPDNNGSTNGNSGGGKRTVADALMKLADADKRTSEKLDKLAENINQLTGTMVAKQNDDLEKLPVEEKSGGKTDIPNVPPDDGKSAWSEGSVNLVGGSLLDIKDTVKQGSASADLIFEESDEINLGVKDIRDKLDEIYNKISNGIQVTNNGSGNTPAPAIPPSNAPSGGGNPKPKNPTPQNPTPLPTRTREDIDELARLELDDLNSQIQDLQFLLKQTGGIADSVFSQSDLDDVLTKLTDAKSKLDNIVDVASKKNVSPKALVTIDNELTNIQNALSDLNALNPNAYNILSLAENYHNAFDIESDELNADEILKPLKEMRDLLADAHIDTSSYDNAISEIEGRVERLKNTVESWTSVDLDASQFSSAYDAVEKMSDELSDSLDGFKPLAQNAEDQIKQIFDFDDEIEELDKLENKITSFYGLIQKTRRGGTDLNTIDIGNGKTLADAESLFQDYFNKKDSLNQYTQGQFSSEAEFTQYRAEIEANLIQPILAYISNMNDAKIAIESVKTAEKDLADEARKASQNLTLNKQISNKITELTQWREINSKAMTVPANKAEWQRYFDALKNGEISSTEALKKFNKEWSDFNRRVKEAGQSGKTTTSILTAMYKKFGGWTLVTRSITQAIRLMKDMVVQVKEVDNSMVNLRKVTDASEQSLEKYRKTAAKASINLGTSLTDQIDATSIFSRLGYELDEAEKLGEIASTYKSVAEDLDIDTASQSIISTLKAYQNLGVTADEIVDKFNYVGNNFAISSAGVGDALQRSASSLNAANNTLSESMALITAGNEIIQDPEKMGTALKTISARIRGAKTELEEEGEEMTMTVSKLREEIKSLSGVDIMIDDKTFKSTYDILNELSRVWKELSDADQSRIGEMLGGKVGINTVYAVLENFETARDVVKELDEGMAEGSAERELATALDSIQGKLNQLQSTWQSLSTNVIDSELVKDGLDWVVKFGGGLNDILGSLKNIKGIGAGLLTFGGMTALQAQLKNKTGSGRVRMFTLDEYARVSSGGNTERVDLIDKGALEKLPKLVQCTTSFMNLVREGWLKSHRIRSQAYLVGRFREYNGRTAKVVMGYSGQLRERSKIIRSDSLLRWENAT